MSSCLSISMSRNKSIILNISRSGGSASLPAAKTGAAPISIKPNPAARIRMDGASDGVARVAHGSEQIEVVEHVHGFEKYQILRHRQRFDQRGFLLRRIVARPELVAEGERQRQGDHRGGAPGGQKPGPEKRRDELAP